MNITANEIDLIEDAGTLNKLPVKLLKTKGGFWIAVGSPNGKEEAIAAGGHPAIVKYNLQKQYPGFQPIMMKSESVDNSVVNKHSRHLSDELLKSGHDIYSVQNGTSIQFHITKHDMRVGMAKAELESDSVVIKEMNAPKEFSQALAGATSEKALSCGATKVRIQGK